MKFVMAEVDAVDAGVFQGALAAFEKFNAQP